MTGFPFSGKIAEEGSSCNTLSKACMSLGDVLSTRASFESDRGAPGVRAIRALVFRGGVQNEVAGFSALRGGEEQRSLRPREDILREESRRQNLNCT